MTAFNDIDYLSSVQEISAQVGTVDPTPEAQRVRMSAVVPAMSRPKNNLDARDTERAPRPEPLPPVEAYPDAITVPFVIAEAVTSLFTPELASTEAKDAPVRVPL